MVAARRFGRFLAAALLVTAIPLSAELASAVEYRESFIEGFTGERTDFVFHAAETGYREVEALFLGSISSTKSIDLCCERRSDRLIRLKMADAYYVRLGRQQVLIEQLDMAWVKGDPMPYFVLNNDYALIPSVDSKAFRLLSEWAKERGFQ